MSETKRAIKVNGHSIEFTSHNGKHWRGNVPTTGFKVEVEIEPELFIQGALDWAHFEEFCNWLNMGNQLDQVVQEAAPAMLATGKAFFRRCPDEVAKWEMGFDRSIIYHGHPKHETAKGNFAFSLVHSYALKGETVNIDGDPYGLYLVNMENWQVVGTKRIQC